MYQRRLFLSENDMNYYDLPNSHIQNFDLPKQNLDPNISKFLLNKFPINKTKKNFCLLVQTTFAIENFYTFFSSF